MKFMDKLILLFILSLVGSCVGTVKDKNATTGNIIDTGTKSELSFSGLIQANPIAHNKVELIFYPAKGDQNNITYEIYINGSPIASKLSGKALPVNTKGMMSTVITNLSINTSYTFNIKAIETGSSASSTLDPTKALTAKTFANETADFQGISTVVLGAGESGKTTAIVSWLSAVTKGSAISPKPTDPVAYEVKYISQLGGVSNLNNSQYTGPDKVTLQNPSTLSTSPTLSTQTSMTINGLNPGTLYYFQVRAIHKNFAIFGTDSSYKRESNTRYLYVKTLDSSGIFDFATNQVLLTNPIGEAGLTKLNVSWLPASGDFNHYRICYTKVGEPNVDPSSVTVADNLVDSGSFAINDCISKNADDTFHQLISLESYAYYQVKVVACKTALCEFGNRIMSDLMAKRVTTNVAPFSGLASFSNPEDESNLTTIKFNFSPAVISAGYINQFRMYCYANKNDNSPIRIDNLAFPTSGTGKTNCNGLTINSTFPSSLNDFSTFEQIEVSLPVGGIDSIKEYCFSLVPTIESAYLTQSDVTNSIVKCVTPQIKTPNILQFPGRNELCNVVNKDIQVTWPIPTGGLYSKYIVFYQAKTTGAEFFDFQEAINEYTASTPIKYNWVDNIDKALMANNLTGLVPGTKYNIGVLPYLIDGATKLWGQFNYNVGECSLPLPKAKFKEWMQVIATGPKEDGLTPVDQLGNRNYILETINNDDQVVEIKTTTADIRVPDALDTLAVNKTGSINFDGIYGRYKANDVNPLHQYSNSGIVKIAWKDVSLYSDTENLHTYNDSPANKYDRKFGYRIYRSDDNKLTWKDLTAKTSANPYQTNTNAGPVQSFDFSWRKRNNDLTAITDKVSSFTDYSVKFSGINGEIDRARVYYYKIVPIFNGKELLYDDTTNPNHHIIKVVLPPRNMALVHRMMANKTICYEMDLAIKKGAGEHYACDYDGVGSSHLNPPYSVGNTVYDQGGDSLIDRFELGLSFTRGDPSTSNSNSEFSGDKLNFTGLATNGSKYTGCFNNSSDTNATFDQFEPHQGAGLLSGTYSYKNIMPGDCIGRDIPARAADMSTACSDPLKVATNTYLYPGSPPVDIVTNCTGQAWTGNYFTNLNNSDSLILNNNNYAQTQSEFGAVYFIRNGNANLFNGDSKGIYNYPAGNGKFLKSDGAQRLSLSFVNFPYINALNEMMPRWLPIGRLFGNYSVEAIGTGFTQGNSVSLYDKTIDQVLSSTLYDETNVKAPGTSLTDSFRYNRSSTPIARIFSSNASKLPPLGGLSMGQFHKVCSTYKIQVGIETTTLGYKVTSGSTSLSKRLMRKKEATVASAWPMIWNNAKVTNIEKGTDANGKGCNGASKANPNGTASLSKNSPIDNLIPWANSSTPFTLTGSSEINSTEECSSRFGIQDLAGNMREYTSEQLFCTFLSSDPMAHKPSIYIGNPLLKDVFHSVPYDHSYLYDHSTAQPWVRGYPDSGTCSTVEIGGNHLGNYTTGSIFNSIFEPDSTNIDATVILKPKTLDQDSVLANRNGDGSFLDFGISNVGPVINEPDAFNKAGFYFNAALGLPLGCTGGCSTGAGGDNKRLASDYHAGLPGSTYDLGETPIQNFPVNNSKFQNYGVEDIAEYGYTGTNDESLVFPFSYVSGINDLGDPGLNTLAFTTINSPTPTPGLLYKYYFKVDRNSPMRFTIGGSAFNEPGRYTFFMDGVNDYDDRRIGDKGGRCAILLEE